MILDKDAEYYIKDVIQGFQATPNHGRYYHVIKPFIIFSVAVFSYNILF